MGSTAQEEEEEKNYRLVRESGTRLKRYVTMLSVSLGYKEMCSEIVRISREAKRELKRLQARLVIEAGRKYSLRELVDAAIRVALRRQEELLEALGEWRPLSKEEAEKLLDIYSIDADVEDIEKDMRDAAPRV